MIRVIWPTIRAASFKKGWEEEWLCKVSNLSDIELHVVTNFMAIAKEIEKTYPVVFLDVKKPGVSPVTHAFFASLPDTAFSDSDIFVLASDDFAAPQDWDHLLERYVDHDGACVLVVNDGNEVYGSRLVSLPIFNGYALRALHRVIYHSDYNHCYADLELYENATALGVLRDIRNIEAATFAHRHYYYGNDQQRDEDDVDRAIQSYRENDRETFQRRMQMSVEERLLGRPAP